MMRTALHSDCVNVVPGEGHLRNPPWEHRDEFKHQPLPPFEEIVYARTGDCEGQSDPRM